MKRTVFRLLAMPGVAGLLAGIALAGVLTSDPSSAGAQAPPEIAIDADITNGAGPCDPVDASLNVSQSQTFDVAVCLLDNVTGVAVAGYEFRVLYDGTILSATGGTNTAPGLDANPDANAGTTVFTSATYPNDLGGGWDCTAGGISGPNPDQDGIAGNANGSAFSGGCGTNAGPATLITGPLAVITFTASAGPSTALTLANVNIVDNDLNELGTCNPSISVPATCTGATINVVGAPTNTPTNTPTQTRTPTSTSTPCVNQQGTPCPSPSAAPRTATFTPTRTVSVTTTAPAGQTPPTGQTPGPGQPTATRVGGGPGGVIQPPDTGTGADSQAGALWAQLIGLGGVAAAAAGVLLGRRRFGALLSGRITRRR